MNRSFPFIIVLATLSIISGYLLSKASFIGRTGIHFFYRQYQFLRVWWQGALAVFIILLLIFLIHHWVQQRATRRTAIILYSTTLFLGIVGLFFTYLDFRNDLSHRLLGERFHLGAYLFWCGWMLIPLFYLFVKPNKTQVV